MFFFLWKQSWKQLFKHTRRMLAMRLSRTLFILGMTATAESLRMYVWVSDCECVCFVWKVVKLKVLKTFCLAHRIARARTHKESAEPRFINFGCVNLLRSLGASSKSDTFFRCVCVWRRNNSRKTSSSMENYYSGYASLAEANVA